MTTIKNREINYKKEIDRLNNIIKNIQDYVNFLQIETPEGYVPFNKTIWGEEILELAQGSDK